VSTQAFLVAMQGLEQACQLSKVDLPAPSGPRIATMEPCGMVRLRFSTARVRRSQVPAG